MQLTLPQQDIYLEQLLYPNEPIYNIGAKIEILGPLDRKVFGKAYVELINQHDAYRMILIKESAGVQVKILETHDSELGFVDFSHLDEAEERANAYMQKQFMRPFDLTSGALLHQFTLVKVREEFHYLYSCYHHIITDGWGTSLMFQRLVRNYNELIEHGVVETNYPFTYLDFAKDDLEYQKSESLVEDKSYWLEKFKTLPERLFDKKDESIHVNKSQREVLIIKRALYNRLIELAKEHKASTFHIILAALYTYFARKHNNKDFAIGLPVLNRSKRIYKKTVGLFMGVSPLRIELDFDQKFDDLINQIRFKLRKDYRHQRLPLGKLVQELQIFKEKEKLFQISLSYEKQDYAHHFHNTKTRVIPLTHQSERVALAIYIREFDESEDVKIDFDYNINYFDASSIRQVVKHFEQLLVEILVFSDKSIKELNYLTGPEKKQLLTDFNQTHFQFDENQTFLNLFQAKVQTNPQKVALKDHAYSFTYAALNAITDKVATYFTSQFLERKEAPFAVLLERSAHMVVVLLGILKAGRAFIPLDPTFPEERIRYILESSQAPLIIANKNLQGAKPGRLILELEDLLNEIEGVEAKERTTIAKGSTAYIIYTSGSTGNPKGVEIGHRSLLNFLLCMRKYPGVQPEDVLFSVTTPAFDISLLEFFVPLISGATVYIADQATLFDSYRTIESLTEVNPTIIQATPSFYQMLFNAGWKGDSGLKILCGGDLLSEALADKVLKTCAELWNMYGPTETTIWSSVKKIEYPSEASNIGKPIGNTSFFILDDYKNPLPIGSRGAIFIGGEGLAKGYYQADALTSQKFIEHPFEKQQKIYATGDIGKWNEKGEILFLGRDDNQVKIRGFRIELGEIETQLNQLDSIRDSVVIAKKGNQQDGFLVAYVIWEGIEVEASHIMNQLRHFLPEYMIPRIFVGLDKFPLTPNQKVDRKVLKQKKITRPSEKIELVTPTSDLEQVLLDFWQQVLDYEGPISITDNFFELGGHSLNAVKLLGLINEYFGLQIGLREIFDYSTIERQAYFLSSKPTQQFKRIPAAEEKMHYALTPAQYKIWVASQREEMSVAYNMSGAYWVKGRLDLGIMEQAITTILGKYESLRTNFVEMGGLPFQVIRPLAEMDFKISHSESSQADLAGKVQAWINQPFNFEKDILVKVKCLQLDADKFLVVFSTHHLIVDGWSLQLFLNEFIDHYKHLLDKREMDDRSLSIQFKDYSEWLNKELVNWNGKNTQFWQNYLEGYEAKAFFRRKRAPRSESFQRRKTYSFHFDQNHSNIARNVIRKENVSIHTFWATLLNVLMYKMTGQEDICLAVMNSGRSRPEIISYIGMFAKTVILRTQIKPEESFNIQLLQTHEDLLTIDQHQDLPLSDHTGGQIEVLLNFQREELFNVTNNFRVGDLEWSTYSIEGRFSRFPLVFNVFEKEAVFFAEIEFDAQAYTLDLIHQIEYQFKELLGQVINDRGIPLDCIELVQPVQGGRIIEIDLNI